MTFRVIGYLAREHGLAGLDALLGSGRYRPIAVFTHRRKAKFEDPERGERPDHARYVAVCAGAGVPLFEVDTAEQARQIPRVLAELECDFLASISWRRLITPEELACPRLGGVNLHRGSLPEYPGGLPLHQALKNGDERVAITAHVLSPEIDGGEVLDKAYHPVNYQTSVSIDENVERLKRELTPSFGPLLLRALDKLAQRT